MGGVFLEIPQEGLHLVRAVQVHVRHQPKHAVPVGQRRMHLHQVVAGAFEGPHEAQADPVQHRLPRRHIVTRAEDDLVGGDIVPHPARKGRAAGGIVVPYEAVPRHPVREGRHAMAFDVLLAAVDRELQVQEGLHDIVGLAGRAAGADRHMGLAILQPEQPGRGQVAQDHIRVILLELRQHRHHEFGNPADGGHHQLARDVIAAPLDPPGQLAELVVRRLGHAQQVLPGLGRGIATGMALEQLDAQPGLQRVDMADHSGMVHAQNLGRARHRAQAGHLKGGADLVPIVHAAVPFRASDNIEAQENRFSCGSARADHGACAAYGAPCPGGLYWARSAPQLPPDLCNGRPLPRLPDRL